MDKKAPPLHIVAVTGVVIKDGKFLAGVRSDSEVAFPGLWAVPGGKVEVGQSLEEGLREELIEEAGVEVKNIFYVGTFEFTRPDDYHVIGLEFGCEYASGKVKAGEDMDTMEWLIPEEAEGLEFIPGVVDYVKRAFAIYNRKAVK